MTGTLGDGVLDWMLRRHESSFRPIDTDLLLICEHAVLGELSDTLVRGSEGWRVARARGQLSLRRALLDVDRAIVVIPRDMSLPLDVSERAYLRRPLLVEAADVVAAITHRFCQRIHDPNLADAVMTQADQLATKDLWSDGGAATTEADVRRAMLRVCLGLDRDLERTAPSELLTRWLVGEVPRDSPLVVDALRRTHGLEGAWLADVIERGPDALVTAGALAGTERARSEVPVQPAPATERDWLSLRSLVEPAVRRVAEQAPARLDALLERAEAAASAAGLSPMELGRHPLLKEPLDVALARHAAAAASLEPVDQSDLDRLGKNIHARARADHLELVTTLTRIARFLGQFVPPASDAGVEAWAMAHRDSVAWADLAARRARRLSARVGGDMVRHTRTLLGRYLLARDAYNAAFAAKLAHEEVSAFRSGVLREALPLHLVTRSLVQPLARAGQRVLLLVLDGCDVSTLLEMLLSRELYERRMGLALPEGISGSLRSDLELHGPLFTGLAPLPTVTSHARRALFAGELPGNPILDEPEAAAGNASADLAAWERNPSLDGIARGLLLKRDLGADGDAVVTALEQGGLDVLSVVFNGVDDALSSKETTAMGPWSFASAGAGLRRVIETAVDAGWVVVVTADHGHTPFWRADRKVAPRGTQRYAKEPLEGSVKFGAGPLRKAPLHLLTDVGAFVGGQRRGFHGGAGLEEVVVPIALIGKPRAGDGLPTAPAWWSGATAPEASTRPPSAPPLSSIPPPSVKAPVVEPLGRPIADEPAWLPSVTAMFRKVVMHLHQHGVVTETEIAELTGSPRAPRRFVRELDKLADVLPWRYEVETIGNVKRYLPKGFELMTLSKRDKSHVFQRLRDGLVPERGLDTFAVGIEKERGEIHRLLGDVAGGEGIVKFLRGGYGCGKTFLAQLATIDARSQGFATSFVVVSDNNLRFHRFDDVYRKVVTELATDTCPRGALGDILDRWVAKVEDMVIDAGADEGDSDFDAKVQKRLAEELASITRGAAPPDFVRVVQKIFELQQASAFSEAGALISWLSGSGNVAAAAKKVAGIRSDIQSTDALAYLRGIVAIIKAAGYKGLVIVIDETETISRIRSDVRAKCLNGLRQIVDASASYPGLLWLFTGTPDFFDGRRGVAALPPLHDRIRFMEDNGFASLRQAQLRLKPFDARRLRDVALRLRELYPSTAGERVRERVTNEVVETLVADVTRGFHGDVGVVPRQFLRAFVHKLDLVDENPDYDPTGSTEFKPVDLTPEEQAALERRALDAADEDDEDIVPVEDVW